MDTRWRKSSFSEPRGADCLEVAYATDVRVRDSKNPDGGTLVFPALAWVPERLVSA
ncbi:MAG TPA: DUF397 domain-containing protein [Actinokineospora sp.]|jgi:hypothetical protein|nr:DUF397 domain-containing protein [Actinokineospora sp.]